MLTKEVKQGRWDLWGNELQKVGAFHVGLVTWVGSERLMIFPVFFFFPLILGIFIQQGTLFTPPRNPWLCKYKWTHSSTATSITYKGLQIFASMVWSNIQLTIDLKCCALNFPTPSFMKPQTSLQGSLTLVSLVTCDTCEPPSHP